MVFVSKVGHDCSQHLGGYHQQAVSVRRVAASARMRHLRWNDEDLSRHGRVLFATAQEDSFSLLDKANTQAPVRMPGKIMPHLLSVNCFDTECFPKITKLQMNWSCLTHRTTSPLKLTNCAANVSILANNSQFAGEILFGSAF